MPRKPSTLSVRRRARDIWSRLRRVSLRHLGPDALLLAASLLGSLWLRLGWLEGERELPILLRHLPILLGARLMIFAVDGVYDIVWRYFSVVDALRLLRAFLGSLVVILALSFVMDTDRLPRAVFFIDAMLGLLLLTGMRLLRRLLFEKAAGSRVSNGKRTVIFGAGLTGKLLAARFATEPGSGAEMMGFVDDDPKKLGRIVAGMKVLGNRDDLPEILRNTRAQELVIAMARPTGEVIRSVVQACRNQGVPVRMVSGLHTKDGSSTQPLRTVTLSDLLNRPQRQVPIAALRGMLRGKRVLVTGAGGSIGSELSRQILDQEPASLVLVDHSEFALFQIDSELRVRSDQGALIFPMLVDVRDTPRIEAVFSQHRPEVVFHAAAYKHVHLVEANPYASILNNVLGTWNTVKAASANGTGAFVLISTDKAVNPAGVMGATKRVCELLVAALAMETQRNYCSVRFGNVLGSSGSLIPTLAKQIENGEPVTITHPEMERYFMLIPEAVSLVLRAATLVDSGAIAILRMGEPVRIVEIARSLIALMGKTEEEIPLVFTGVRPGEKLREELYLSGNEVNTEDPDILLVPSRESVVTSTEPFLRTVSTLVALAEGNDPAALRLLASIVVTPETQLGVRGLADQRPFLRALQDLNRDLPQ